MANKWASSDPHRGDYDPNKVQDHSAEYDYLKAVQRHGGDSLEAKIAGAIADAKQKDA